MHRRIRLAVLIATATIAAPLVAVGMPATADTSQARVASSAEGGTEAATSAAGAAAAADPATPRNAAAGAAAGAVRAACQPARPPFVTCFAKIRVGQRGKAGVPEGYGPADLRGAYQLPDTGGAGRTIAVVLPYSNPTLEADLAVYRQTYGLPACTVASGCLRIVNQEGAVAPLPAPDQSWAVEMAINVDMVSAACPSCQILVVQARSHGLDDLGTAVTTAARMGAEAISNSYGTAVEFAGQNSYEKYFRQPGHAVVVAAGDLGFSVSYPAASAHVIAVGGTTLRREDDGTWTEEVWSSTGSGCSAYIPKPSWQHDPNCPTRTMNDLAVVADPGTGVAVHATYGAKGWLVAGGTSVGAPLVAAAYALTGATDRVMDGSAPWLNRGSGFRDVVTGSNVPGPSGATCGEDYLCTGLAGYDAPSGWGGPTGLTGLIGP